MNPQLARKRFEAAQKLLSQETISLERFKAIQDLIGGFNSKLDQTLDSCSKELGKIEKIQKGEVIELSAQHLPENTEEEKRRKRLILLFLKNWGKLKAEVKRVRSELEQTKTQGKVQTSGKIAAYAKGPLGIITLVAVLVVGFTLLQPKTNPKEKETTAPTPILSGKPKIKVIEFQGKKIPLSEIAVRTGSDCDSPHYHALDHVSATALDGEVVQDPGGCGFGRVKDTSIVEVQ